MLFGYDMGTVFRTQLMSKKSIVSIEALSDRGLRLRWRHNSKRHCLALGLQDSLTNRTVAEAKARQIELDIVSGHFDESLDRYRLQSKLEQRGRLTISELFQRFMNEKEKDVYKRTMEKYQVTLKSLQKHFANKQAVELTEVLGQEFANSLKLSELTLKERIGLVRAAWDYGIKLNLVQDNPWEAVLRRIRVSPKQAPKPFTREEIGKIIEAFRSDCYYNHYANYVEFLLLSGVRIGEAIGLRWGHISDDCSSVWIGESISSGVRKTTKTNKARVIKLSKRLQTLLLERKPEQFDPEMLVFPAKQGGCLDAHNFRNRAWVSILEKAEVPYRKPYNTRHTMVSHALESGMSPATVAQLTGHDVQTLYQSYAGSVQSHPQLPDFS
jgi:integrase